MSQYDGNDDFNHLVFDTFPRCNRKFESRLVVEVHALDDVRYFLVLHDVCISISHAEFLDLRNLFFKSKGDL